MSARCIVFNLFLVIATAVATADQSAPWRLGDWKARAVVEVTGRSPDADCDTAVVRILCLGRAKPDGSDYRVLDSAGQPVPFQLAFHDADRYSLIAFRCSRPGEKYFVYFGNAGAAASGEQVAWDMTPGTGPPKGAWTPRSGVVYTTLKRPEGDNPETADAMAKLIAASPGKCGAQIQRRISDGYNPFGPSDYYISVYRGWIRIPRSGAYRFCTVSNEASFSFIDGKELIHWPGRHTIERGSRGEKNAQLELTAGLHYIEYYHEEVTLQQMAFLGWRPSGDDGPFDAIPETVFTAPHAAVVSRYEASSGPLIHFEPRIVDSVWPTQRHEGQYTRVEFRAGASAPEGTTYRWEFGDGQTASGAEASHVYLALGKYEVTLAANGPGGTQTARWPLDIFEIQHAVDQFPEGRPADYLAIARRYNRSRLNARSLRELAHLFAEQEDPAGAIDVAKSYLDRFASVDAATAARVRRLIADCSIQLGDGAIDEAIANYQASIIADTPAAEKLDVLARLIRLVGIERNLPDKAGQILEQVEETVRGARRDEETIAAYRRAVTAAADVLLWNGKRDGAGDLYRRAETLAGRFISPQVRSARTGAYPGEIREHIAKTNYGAAIAVVDEWEETFPTEKLKGETFFWRGKLLALRGGHRGACRYLARSAGLAVGAVFETECRFILADSLAAIGKNDESRRELAKLAALGLDDKFVEAAKDRLKNAPNLNKN